MQLSGRFMLLPAEALFIRLCIEPQPLIRSVRSSHDISVATTNTASRMLSSLVRFARVLFAAACLYPV
jgi:hypothetical protein